MDATTTVNTIDHSAWKARFDEASTRIQDRVQSLWRGLARDPARLQRLQTALIVVLVLWSLSSVSQLIWIPFRTNPIEVAPALALNPPKPTGGKQTAVIDTSGVLGLGLFGGSPEAFADADSAALTEASRDGIEQNAQETRLALTLTGIVASTEDGSGSAVIKSGAAEQVYAVGDALPASGQVVLAKVMPQQVVIDNNGTYELMKLYEGPGIAIPTRTARHLVKTRQRLSLALIRMRQARLLRRRNKPPWPVNIVANFMTAPNRWRQWSPYHLFERVNGLSATALRRGLIALPSMPLDFKPVIL